MKMLLVIFLLIVMNVAASEWEDFEELKSCNEGLEFDEQQQKCVKKDLEGIEELNSCNDGLEFDEQQQKCVKKTPENCEDGKKWNSEKKMCEISEDSCKPINNMIKNIISTQNTTTTKLEDNCNRLKRCSDFDGFKCVSEIYCSDFEINTDGTGLIEIRSIDDEDEDLCCKKRQGFIDLNNLQCEQKSEICCKTPDYSTKVCGLKSGCAEDTRTKQSYEECGRIIKNPPLRFLNKPDKTKSGGNLADPGEFPHMCLIYRKVITDGISQHSYLGGASIISRNKVLTVAHKFLIKRKSGSTNITTDEDIYVRCGEYNVKLEENLLEYQETKVKRIHIHPDYHPTLLSHNLAILQLEKNLIYQEHIGPVCLPNPNQDFAGFTECFSTGWGASEISAENSYSDILKKIQLKVNDREDCKKVLSNLPRVQKTGKRFNLYPSWICVGGDEGRDTCEGDGGSPHVCNINEKWIQVGAVAFGFGCNRGIPAIYSSVSEAMCWIDYLMTCIPISEFDVINEKEFDAANEADIRNIEKQSVNGLKGSDCEDWLKNHNNLLPKCNIAYRKD